MEMDGLGALVCIKNMDLKAGANSILFDSGDFTGFWSWRLIKLIYNYWLVPWMNRGISSKNWNVTLYYYHIFYWLVPQTHWHWNVTFYYLSTLVSIQQALIINDVAVISVSYEIKSRFLFKISCQVTCIHLTFMNIYILQYGEISS